MTSDVIGYLLYLVPLVLVLFFYLRHHNKQEQRHVTQMQQAVEAGLTEPASLHPVIDPRRCLGSKACVTACPEDAIGIIGGKGQLVNPASCIGHGACKTACPHDAIQLVFGTANRGTRTVRGKRDTWSGEPECRRRPELEFCRGVVAAMRCLGSS